MNLLLSFQHVGKVKNGIPLLQDISFNIKKEIYGLVVPDYSLGLRRVPPAWLAV